MTTRTRCVTAVFLVLFLAVSHNAADMTLIYGGESIILRDNNTWEFKNQNAPQPRKDFEVILDDGRIIHVAVDGGWRFIDKSELDPGAAFPVHEIRAKGAAQNQDLAAASAVAMNNALANAAAKMKAAAKNKKMDQAKLLDCIRRVEKEVDTNENFTKGSGWRVAVDIVMDRGSILAVLDCEAGVTPAAGEPEAGNPGE